jgi:hypothetical protein
MLEIPEEVVILGNHYKVIKCEDMLDVDPRNRTTMFGNIDLYTRTIRLLVNEDRTEFDTFQTLLHEMIHGIANELSLGMDEATTDILATVLLDTFMRNGFIE